VAISWPFDLENSKSQFGFPNTRNHAMWQQPISQSEKTWPLFTHTIRIPSDETVYTTFRLHPPFGDVMLM